MIIVVESKKNQGSTFRFTAQFERFNEKDGATISGYERLQGEKRAQDASKLKGLRVLLVEDDEINQELAVELLTRNRIEVVTANNGQEALAILKDQEFDGVLMDCQMPIMDGYEATRKIREQEKFKDIPVIALTANAMAGDREKDLEAGMNDHIAKPIKPDEMYITMAKWISANDE